MTFALEQAREHDFKQLQIRREMPSRPRPDLTTGPEIKAAVAVARSRIEVAKASVLECEEEQASAAKTLENANALLATLLAEADAGWPPKPDALISARQAVVNAETEVDLLNRAHKAREALWADERSELFGLAQAIYWLFLSWERDAAQKERDKRIEAEKKEQALIEKTMAARSEYEGIRTVRDADYALARYGL